VGLVEPCFWRIETQDSMELARHLVVHRVIPSETANQGTRGIAVSYGSWRWLKRAGWQKELSGCNQVR
jgi:hypothetical protein